MIDVIVRGTLGELGSAILDFYYDNSLWINGIVLLYVLLLVLARRGYLQIQEAIKSELISNYGTKIFTRNESSFIKAYGRTSFDWESIVRQTKIPIISEKGSLLFHIKSSAFIKQNFTAEKAYEFLGKEKPKSRD